MMEEYTLAARSSVRRSPWRGCWKSGLVISWGGRPTPPLAAEAALLARSWAAAALVEGEVKEQDFSFQSLGVEGEPRKGGRPKSDVV